MATAKKKSATTIIKDLRAELAAAQQEAAKLTKERDQEKTSKGYAEARAKSAQDELDQAHALLDVLPGACPRQSEPGEYGGRTNHAIVTRIGSLLAAR